MNDDAQRSHLLFEFFKHMSTLDAAAVAAIVAIGQAVDLGLGLTLTGLLGFGWSLIAAVFGMLNILGVFGEHRSGGWWLLRLIRLMAVQRTPAWESDYYSVVAAGTCVFAFLFTFLVITGALHVLNFSGV